MHPYTLPHVPSCRPSPLHCHAVYSIALYLNQLHCIHAIKILSCKPLSLPSCDSKERLASQKNHHQQHTWHATPLQPRLKSPGATNKNKQTSTIMSTTQQRPQQYASNARERHP